MKYISYCACLALGLAVTACSTTSLPQSARGPSEMWVGESIRSAALNKAIIVQRTLYPYHFVEGAASLNQLGQRDLGVLAEHLAQHPGDLSVHQGRASDALLRKRLEHVADSLVESGVERTRVLQDRVPAGDGISSERVLRILEREQNESGAESTSTSGITELRN